MKQKNFAFRYEWLEIIDPLDYEEQMEVIQAIALFCRTGEVEQLTYYANERFVNDILPTLQKRRKAAQYRARLKEKKLAAAAKADELRKVAVEAKAKAAPQAEPEPAAGEGAPKSVLPGRGGSSGDEYPQKRSSTFSTNVGMP